MKRLEEFNAKRATLARHYFQQFGTDFEAQTGAELPVADFENSNWHMFHLVLPERGTCTIHAKYVGSRHRTRLPLSRDSPFTLVSPARFYRWYVP